MIISEGRFLCGKWIVKTDKPDVYKVTTGLSLA